jgi:hypothetical protein
LKKTLENGKDHSCLWIGKINIVKIAMLLKVVHKFNAIPIKNLMTFFTELEKDPKIHLKAEKTLYSQSNPEYKEQCWRHHNV